MECDWVLTNNRLPPSNKPVLAYYLNALGKYRIIRAQYADRHTLPLNEDCEGGCACGECEGQWVAAGWYEDNEHEEVHWMVGERVTHWTYLPQPPST